MITDAVMKGIHMIELFNAILDPDNMFLRYAFIMGGLASISFGIIGTFVTIKRIGYLAGAISHCVFGGIGLALFLQVKVGLAWFDPLLGAVLAAVIAAVITGVVSLHAKEREDTMSQDSKFEIEQKELPTILIAGYRMKGAYADVGKGFSKLGKKVGRHINGKSMALYYDAEYREQDADFEACFPVRKGVGDDEISVRELPGGRAVTLIHKGPYDTISNAYKRVFAYIQDSGIEIAMPYREVYLKGPGMIFKGNPKNYLTEIQMPLAEPVD